MPLYKIYFKDGTFFDGGPNIHNSRWMEIPDKPIVRLEYFIYGGEGIILEGFESYLCFVEAEAVVAKPVGNCPKCGEKGKISKRITKYSNGSFKQTFVARCKKCDWVGNLRDLKDKCSHGGDKFIYIMGLKGNKVTSYRVSIDGEDGKNKYQKGDYTRRILELGKEFRGRPTNLILWKIGIK